jgi:betaine-aldehyde dehydrogenase
MMPSLPHQLYINGTWADATGGLTGSVLEPATGEIIAEIGYASPVDVDRAVKAAAKAFRAWSRTGASERGRFLIAIGEGLARRKDVLAQMTARNNGKPLAEALADIDDAVACYAYYGALAAEQDTNEPVSGVPDGLHVGKVREPLGVAALIVPWNFPLTTSAWKVAPALAAGCTVVLKPSEITPFAELALGLAVGEAGLPDGVVNIIVGGADCGAALVAHPMVDKISFTGSNTVGRLVMRAAAERFVPVTLELGGKSPIIVFDDYDLDRAADLIIGGIFTNCGQVCSATSRLLVDQKIAPALREKLKQRARSIVLGDPMDPSTTMGPLTSRTQLGKVTAAFDRAREEGLTLVTGGATRRGAGNFVWPTIYWDVPAESALWREEIFGPVLCAHTFSTEEEALTLANDTMFGLGAAVLSRDVVRARRLASAIKAGNVWINGPQYVFPQGSWGGFKASGFGRELGLAGLHGFTSIKQITLEV